LNSFEQPKARGVTAKDARAGKCDLN